MAETKSRIGRPKKNNSVDVSLYHCICDTPKSKTSVIEFSNTEPFDMSKYLKTLKSNDVFELHIECLEKKVNFWGKMAKKVYSEEYSDGEDNFMLLSYDCTKVYRYYCKHPVFISIDERESITNLLGEISESSKKIKMTVNNNFTDSVNFTISNATLSSKNEFSVNCIVEFHQPNKLPPRPTTAISEKYCTMKNIDIGEYKKELNSRFKKKVVTSKISFDCREIVIEFMKDSSKKMRTIYKINEETHKSDDDKIELFTDHLTEINYPKNNISDFLLHIKGEFSKTFYKDYIILMYKDKNVTLISYLYNQER
jgi:hypothetical protein